MLRQEESCDTAQPADTVHDYFNTFVLERNARYIDSPHLSYDNLRKLLAAKGG